MVQQTASAPMPTNNFRELTRQQIVQIAAQTFSTYGQVQTYTLPNTGFLGRIWFNMQGNITIPATPSGNWASYPPVPFMMVRRFRVYTSENVEVVNCSGWALAFHELFQKRLGGWETDSIAYLNPNNILSLYQTKSGALVAGTYPLNATWMLPIMTDDATMLGMLMLQTLDIRCFFEVTFANAADFVSSGGTLPTTLAMTGFCEAEFYSVPNDPNSMPNMTWVHFITEDFFQFSAVGDLIYRPQLGNVYLSLKGIVESSGAQVATSNINTASVAYAQTVRPYYEPYVLHVARSKWNYGYTIPDASWVFDWTLGSGDPGVDDPRDVMNTSQQTDFQIVINVSGFTPTNAQIRVVKEQLAGIG